MMVVMTSLISWRREISEEMARLFPYLINIFNKYESTLGTLLPALNSYIHYGKNFMQSDIKNIICIIDMASKALFNTKEVVVVNNTEGALLVQVLLQSIGGAVLSPYIPAMVGNAINRLNQQPLTSYLTIELYNIILCAISNNAQATLQGMHSVEIAEKVFGSLLEVSKEYNNAYDIKVLVVGLSTLLAQPTFPPYLNNLQLAMLQIVVDQLNRQVKKSIESTSIVIKRSSNLEDEEEIYSDEDEMEINL
eukprot:TRINITY_DN13038_c0_g2_i1.p1 TRINITY_DN13038_c0_g2~~TRINITY_DN13038_c0_g2_i1.p1  ORF type:complete len:250 (+),score=44.64 TRINITY_DN13038_c0_g2_i1:46-795(+)